MSGSRPTTKSETPIGRPDRRFMALVEDGSELLLRAGRLLCGDWVQAEELLQRALSRALVDWDTDRGDAATWAGVRQELIATYLDDLPDFGGESRVRGVMPTPSVMDGLDELDPTVRAAVVARYYLDLSAKETAEAIGVAPTRAFDVAARSLRWLDDRRTLASAQSR